MNTKPLFCILSLLTATSLAQQPDPTEKLIDKLSPFLIDSAAGSVSAASFLGVSDDAVTHVQDVKDIFLSVKNLASGNGQPVIALAITPARTGLTPMKITTYATNDFYRLVGALNIGYAQGTAPFNGIDYQRRAISIETNYYLNRDEDPIISFANLITKNEGDCKLAISKAIEIKGANATGGIVITPVAPPDLAGCIKRAKDNVRWNASQFSFSAATGRIKPGSGNGEERSLGTTVALGMIFGFPLDGTKKSDMQSALAFTLRRTIDAPVLTTLANPTPTLKNISLSAVRYTFGTKRYRGLVEASHENLDQATASQRVFKRALGLDYQYQPGMWFNLRAGKQKKVNGTGDETITLLSVNITPSQIKQ